MAIHSIEEGDKFFSFTVHDREALFPLLPLNARVVLGG